MHDRVASGAHTGTRAPPTARRRRGVRSVVVAAFVGGMVARVVLLTIAPRYGFLGDHVDYVCWGRLAVERGVLALYSIPPTPCPTIIYAPDRPPERVLTGTGERLNYPPLAAYVFWVEGHLLAALDPSQLANTVTARAVYAIGTTLGELATAIGTGALVRTFASPPAAALAFALSWLAPPLLADGPFWGQTEAWVLGPAVWMVWAMARRRWLLAGALWGVALAWKPSGLIVAPLWAYALLFRRERARIVAAAAVAALIVNAAALPFWITSGPDWLLRTYLGNFVYRFHWTTMMTFNVWYVDLLLTERLDSQTPLLGVPRDLWGTLLLGAGVAAAFALARAWERRHPQRAHLAVIPLATMVTLAAVTFPTRVHSTYTAFVAPFAIAGAFLVPRTAPGAAAFLVASTLQILSWQWGTLLAVHVLPDEHELPAARFAERRAMRQHDRPLEWALTLVSLGATAAMFAGVAAAVRRAPRTATDAEARRPPHGRG